MSRLPLQLRLTAIFAVAMALVLAGAGWFVYARVAGDLDRSLDQELRSRTQDVRALVLHGGALAATRGSLVEPGESFAELVGGDGRVADATAPIESTLLLSRRQLEGARSAPTFVDRPSVPGLDEPARLLAVPLADGRVLVVGTTRENRAETLSSVRTAFLIGGPVALLLASLAAWAVAGAALRPIERMRSRAAEISASSIGERLPVPPSRDEVARLGETLNEMLDRIEAGFERERRFVADASHELRTPLALLRTELELALARGRTPDELAASIRSAAAETERLSGIAEDLLLLARARDGVVPVDIRPTDVADVLETVTARFTPSAGDRVRIEPGRPLIVAADRARLEQAVGNLVDNALRHGAGVVTLAAVAVDGHAEIHVGDDGPGFAKGFAERAFEPFSQADEARGTGGAGLGLAIVRTIVAAHGGRVGAANQPDGGADVWLELPLESAGGPGDPGPPRAP